MNDRFIHRFFAKVKRIRPQTVLGILFVFCAAITLNWTATVLDRCVEAWLGGQKAPFREIVLLIVLLVSCLVFSFLVWAYRHAFRFLRQRAYARSEKTPKECLVFFVSLQSLLQTPPAPGPIRIKDIVLDRKENGLLADANKLSDLKPFWNWEMLLRGIAPHVQVLRRIYLAGSAPADFGSFKDRATCQAFLQPYIPGIEIVPWKDPVDFENVDALDKMLWALIRQERERGHWDDQICIDVTGGQKPTSIAGAVTSLNSNVTIQYVQTGGKKEARIYDLVYEFPAAGSE